jgi:MerR family transcriptional regulator, light-induced transcriptional regulator
MTNAFPLYNLKAVIHETGLSSSTLRAWERRYDLLKPQRSPGGQRLYSEQDISMLKWLVARQAEGLSISRAIEMWHTPRESELQPPQPIKASSPAAAGEGTALSELRDKWLAACLAFDEQAAEQALSQAFAIGAPETICVEVLQRGLAELGARWSIGSVSVQQEHFASALALRRLNTLLSAAAAPTRRGCLLAACPPGEEHDFVLLMMAFLLRRRGWGVVYLGANVPLSQLESTLHATSPRLLLSTAQTLNSAASLRSMAEYAATQGVPLAYGGGVFSILPSLTQRVSGYFLGNDLAAVPQRVERLLTELPSVPPTQPVSTDYAKTLAKFVEKEALIVAAVTAAMQLEQVEPSHLEEANTHLPRYIASALALGDISFLELSVAWLSGLLQNYGQSPSIAFRYYAAYSRAIQDCLGDQAALILNGLAKVAQAA